MHWPYGFCAAQVLASKKTKEVAGVTDPKPLSMRDQLTLRLARLLARVAIRLATKGEQSKESEPSERPT